MVIHNASPLGGAGGANSLMEKVNLFLGWPEVSLPDPVPAALSSADSSRSAHLGRTDRAAVHPIGALREPGNCDLRACRAAQAGRQASRLLFVVMPQI